MLPCHEGRPGGGIGHALGARGANAVLRKQATLSDSRVLIAFAARKARTGFDYVHSAVDDHSRVAYSEVLPDEKGATTAQFLQRAVRQQP